MKDLPNVHQIDDSVYGIGVWSSRNAQYTAPLDARTRKLTGCSAEFSRHPIGRMSLAKARSIARKLWGYSKLAR